MSRWLPELRRPIVRWSVSRDRILAAARGRSDASDSDVATKVEVSGSDEWPRVAEADWAAAFAQVAAACPSRRARWQVVVDPTVAPVFALTSATRLSDDAWRAYAAHHAATVLDASADAFEVRLDPMPGRTRIGCVIPRSLVAALSSHASQARVQLELVPLLAAAWGQQRQNGRPDQPGWFLAAGLDAIQAVHTGPAGWTLLPPWPRTVARDLGPWLDQECRLHRLEPVMRGLWSDLAPHEADRPAERIPEWIRNGGAMMGFRASEPSVQTAGSLS